MPTRLMLWFHREKWASSWEGVTSYPQCSGSKGGDSQRELTLPQEGHTGRHLETLQVVTSGDATGVRSRVPQHTLQGTGQSHSEGLLARKSAGLRVRNPHLKAHFDWRESGVQEVDSWCSVQTGKPADSTEQEELSAHHRLFIKHQDKWQIIPFLSFPLLNITAT